MAGDNAMSKISHSTGFGLSPIKVLFATFFIFIPLYITSCFCIFSEKNKYFDKVLIGSSEQDVIRLLGQPSIIDGNAKGFFRYASEKCIAPCKARFWYENRLTFDIEAWSIEFDKNGRVINKAHWVSP